MSYRSSKAYRAGSGTAARSRAAYKASKAARSGRVASMRSQGPGAVYGRSQSLEAGYVDTAVASRAMSNSTATALLLNTIAQGSTDQTRVGKRVALKSLQIRGTVQGNSGCVAAHGALLIVYDKRPTGVLPGVTDILESMSSDAFMDASNSGRFDVIRRLDFDVQGTPGSNDSDDSFHVVNEYIRLGNRPTVYKEVGTGAIADIAEGSLIAVFVGNTSHTTDLDILSNVGFRLRYVDQ